MKRKIKGVTLVFPWKTTEYTSPNSEQSPAPRLDLSWKSTSHRTPGESENSTTLRFLKDNLDLPSASSREVSLRVRPYGDDGPLTVVIYIHDGARREDVTEAIPKAMFWRDRLQELEGRALHQRIAQTLEKYSPQKLADQLNAELSDCLLRIHKSETEAAAAKSNLLYPILLSPSINARIRALQLLRYMQFSASKADRLIQKGLENIKNGEEPFEADHPFSAEKIAKKVKFWATKKKGFSRKKS